MGFNRQLTANGLRKLAEQNFRDFITGLSPRREVEFSACLAALHNWRRIDWKKVTLYQPRKSSLGQSVSADQVIAADAVALCEYPLFFSDRKDELQWAEFRADILFCSKNRRKIAYVENKIGAGIRKDLIEGVMKCFEKYSLRGKLQKSCFILLSGREFIKNDWYISEMEEVLSRVGQSIVSAHIMHWEDIFNACAAA